VLALAYALIISGQLSHAALWAIALDQQLRIQARIGKIVAIGRDKAARVWRLADRLI
jgi:hypothetical protein